MSYEFLSFGKHDGLLFYSVTLYAKKMPQGVLVTNCTFNEMLSRFYKGER